MNESKKKELPGTIWLFRNEHIRVLAYRDYCKPKYTHHPRLTGFNVGGRAPGEPYAVYTVVAERSSHALDESGTWVPVKDRKRVLELMAKRLFELSVTHAASLIRKGEGQ